MLDLERIIARFVDDVLRAVRAASLDELEGLLGARAASKPSTRTPSEPRAAGGRAKRGEARRPGGPSPRRVKVRREEREAAVGADITDPEALLAAAFASPAPPALPAPDEPDEPATPSTASEPAQSIAAPTATVARLRVGETLARDAGHGVVIRRAKKA